MYDTRAKEVCISQLMREYSHAPCGPVAHRRGARVRRGGSASAPAPLAGVRSRRLIVILGLDKDTHERRTTTRRTHNSTDTEKRNCWRLSRPTVRGQLHNSTANGLPRQKPAAWPAMIAARASPLASPSSLRSSRVLLLGSAKRISSSRSSSNACWPGGDSSKRPRGSRPSRAWEPSRRALSGLGGAGSSHASRSPEIARDCPRPPPAPHDSHAPLAEAAP